MRSPFAESPRLAIEGLSADHGVLKAGGLYVLSVERAELLAPLVLGTLAQLISHGCHATLASTAPAQRLQQARAINWDAEAAVRQEQLVMLKQCPAWDLSLANYGTKRLLNELALFSAQNSYILIENADALFRVPTAPRMRQLLARLREHLAANGNTLLCLLSTQPDLAQIVASQSNGYARLKEEEGVLYWQSQGWLKAGPASIRLLQDARGLCFVPNETGGSDSSQFVPPDEKAVYATARAVANEKSLPSHWQVVKGYDEILQQTEHAIAATILLDGGGPYDLLPLARTIHVLRSKRGRRLKILVRERGGRLRYSQEWLLINLGANLVIQNETSFSRALSMIEAMTGQRFAGEILSNFDAAMVAGAPMTECGYLPSPAFCRCVIDACKRARTVGIANSLLRLPLARGISHLDALQAMQAKRPGDVATADANSIYLFLFACREPDAEDTLARLFKIPVTELFGGQVRWHENAGILAEINELSGRLERNPAPDYSAQIPPPHLADSNAPPRPPDEYSLPQAYRLLPRWAPGAATMMSPHTLRPSPLRLKRQ